MPASPIRYGSLIAVLGLLGSSAPAAAQTVASKVSTARPSHAAQLKSALRSVAAAQAKHRASKGAYAASADQLRLPHREYTHHVPASNPPDYVGQSQMSQGS